MGEMVLDSIRGEIPIVTMRPSVIESTCREPFPGWMEGNRYSFIYIYGIIFREALPWINPKEPVKS